MKLIRILFLFYNETNKDFVLFQIKAHVPHIVGSISQVLGTDQVKPGKMTIQSEKN